MKEFHFINIAHDICKNMTFEEMCAELKIKEIEFKYYIHYSKLLAKRCKLLSKEFEKALEENI